MDIYKLTGELILGSRLKRVGDRLFSDISRVYKAEDVSFEPSWFPLFYLLDQHGYLRISEIAAFLEISPSAVSQMISGLEKKEVVSCRKEGRVRIVSLSESGQELLEKIRPIWDSLKKCVNELLNEGECSRLLLPALSELEAAFNRHSLFERMEADLKKRQIDKAVEIVSFRDELGKDYNRLLLLWFAANRGNIPPDVLNKPESFIQDSGGYIGLALHDGVVIGAVVVTVDSNTGRIDALQVDEKWAGLGIETSLLFNCEKLNSVATLIIRPDLNQNRLTGECIKAGFALEGMEEENGHTRLILVKRFL